MSRIFRYLAGKIYGLKLPESTKFVRVNFLLKLRDLWRSLVIQQNYAAVLFVANLESIIENQCDQQLKEISACRRLEYKINCNISWALLKNWILKLFLQHNKSFERLMELPLGVHTE